MSGNPESPSKNGTGNSKTQSAHPRIEIVGGGEPTSEELVAVLMTLLAQEQAEQPAPAPSVSEWTLRSRARVLGKDHFFRFFPPDSSGKSWRRSL